MKEKEVLLIFKTHLDIGFTDYSANIVSKYLNQFIPNAIKVGRELQNTDTPFLWTTGSWLIYQALKQDQDKSVENAVRDHIISWHALPFTTHTELMNPALFQYGLDLSAELDERFGRKTIGAKMTDVPGHTIGMVPLMAKRGIRFLHIGVNPATPVPPVPPVFRWKYGENEVIVMYQGDYGAAAEFDDFVIYFAHTNDNCGPQSSKEIVDIYERVQKQYPGWKVRAATLNDAAERLLSVPDLPVLEKEIGDTWIHGAATDPQKLSRYRKLLRSIEKTKNPLPDLSESLLLVPEHTWGMDVKTFFRDEQHFTCCEMEQCAAERKVIEKSWEEQRQYVCAAEKLLRTESDYPVKMPELSGYEPTACPENLPVEISWQLFDRSDYMRYEKEYIRLTEENRGWALWDLTKYGIPEYQGGLYDAQVTAAYCKGEKRLYRLNFVPEIEEKHGLPCFYLEIEGNRIDLKWFGKKASRLPQAFWLKIKGFEEQWELHKMGIWVKPEEIVGSPLISAVQDGVRNREVEIDSLDAALVAPFGRRLLCYGEEDLQQDLYFNLYNNIWNTNFPMWYSDDAVFRFEIKKRERKTDLSDFSQNEHKEMIN
ncbi:MAG: DUF5054 domain-containing protein [Fusicatenibacter sp.]|nr:DUF5054 domain-containing protein [Lachnospiraceae bacterium]MDY2938851.1 DUF5054 domain-containing protein [Fusicatenibacter sp.]